MEHARVVVAPRVETHTPQARAAGIRARRCGTAALEFPSVSAATQRFCVPKRRNIQTAASTVWMRRSDVDPERKWTPLADHDAVEVDGVYNGVKSGATVPNGSPHSVTLKSGGKLTFDWRSEPSTLTNAIYNIRYVGETHCSTLEWR